MNVEMRNLSSAARRKTKQKEKNNEDNENRYADGYGCPCGGNCDGALRPGKIRR
jgi:hypothetical protein